MISRQELFNFFASFKQYIRIIQINILMWYI